MDELETLRAEVARLRDLLDENGIDPDPAPPPAPLYGPPTEFEWRMQKLVGPAVDQMVRAMFSDSMIWLDAETNKLRVDPVRIRLPTDFVVRSNP